MSMLGVGGMSGSISRISVTESYTSTLVPVWRVCLYSDESSLKVFSLLSRSVMWVCIRSMAATSILSQSAI
ncbi:hypothetical protein CI610_03740 [invertebrate metagenome]|uniref:Uncharacterized protein n=1 Tax=invertebrate metagenome TaxID=1711999 RepID=A0A2H9T299_9ZZZZ